MKTSELILAMLFIVLAVVAGLSAFSAWQGESAEAPDYEYLDCVPLSDFGEPDAMAGCCEVVEYFGVPYVRMTGVGEIHAVHGSSVDTYTVGKAAMDLLLITGQSNAQFYTDPSYYDSLSAVPPGKCFFLGTETLTETDNYKEASMMAMQSTLDVSQIVDYTAPDGSVRLAQMYPTLMYDYWKSTGHKALVVNSGYGGRGISSWALMNGLASQWTIDVLERTEEVSDGLVELTPVGVLFSQGESDASETVDYYLERLETAVGHFCDGDYGIAFPKVYTILPTHYRYAAPTNPAIAQQSYASEDPRFVVASTLPTELPTDVTARPADSDNIHYNQEVYEWLGEALARAVSEDNGIEPTAETLVYIAPLGEVASLPGEVQALGTSGSGVDVAVTWSGAGADPGTYDVTGEVSVPYGYGAIGGLEAEATLVVSE